jgi:Lrp/AsnC family transcriptional regulator, leucine-responsive regulatory protein
VNVAGYVARRLDEVDLRLLELLRSDASGTLQDMSRKLKMPRPTVQYRVQKLKDLGAIRSIRAIPDFSKLGRPIMVFVLVKFEPRPNVSERSLGTQVASLPGVERVYAVSGEWDLFVEARLESIDSLSNLLIDRLRQLSGVAHTTTVVSLSAIKE